MEFRDANNLKEVLLRYPVPYQPGHLCLAPASKSTLLCLDTSSFPVVVRWLYCNSSPVLGS